MSVELGFTMQRQHTSVWCWAAVGVSCALYYDQYSAWSQCKIVRCFIGGDSPPNCCVKPIPLRCLIPGPLDNPAREGSLRLIGIADGFQAGPIAYSDVKTRLLADLLIPHGIKVLGGIILHFVVVSGYDDDAGGKYVTVKDSFLGDSKIPHSNFIRFYKLLGPVAYTFFVIKTNVTPPCP